MNYLLIFTTASSSPTTQSINTGTTIKYAKHRRTFATQTMTGAYNSQSFLVLAQSVTSSRMDSLCAHHYNNTYYIVMTSIAHSFGGWGYPTT